MKYVRDLYIPGILSCPRMHSHDSFMAAASYRTDNPLVVSIRFMDTFRVTANRDLLLDAVQNGTRDNCAVVGVGDVTYKVLRSDHGTLSICFKERITDEQREAHNRRMLVKYAEDLNEALSRTLEPGQHPKVYVLFQRVNFLGWLQATCKLVPQGTEVPECDIDDAIAKIMEGSK